MEENITSKRKKMILQFYVTRIPWWHSFSVFYSYGTKNPFLSFSRLPASQKIHLIQILPIMPIKKFQTNISTHQMRMEMLPKRSYQPVNNYKLWITWEKVFAGWLSKGFSGWYLTLYIWNRYFLPACCAELTRERKFSI